METAHNGFSDTKDSKMWENISKCSHDENTAICICILGYENELSVFLSFLSFETNMHTNINPMCKIGSTPRCENACI